MWRLSAARRSAFQPAELAIARDGLEERDLRLRHRQAERRFEEISHFTSSRTRAA